MNKKLIIPILFLVLLVSISIPIYADDPICSYNSPLGAWGFAESQNILDCSGNSYDWENNGCTFTPEGLFCDDSESDYLNQSNSFVEFGTDPFTVCYNYTYEGDVFNGQLAIHSPVGMRDAGGDSGWGTELISQSTDQTFFRFVGGAGTFIDSDWGFQYDFQVGTDISHVACFRHNDSQRYIFVNNSLQTEGTDSSSYQTGSSDGFYVGALMNPFDIQSNFTMSFLAIWDSALTDNQILTILNGSVPPPVMVSIGWENQNPVNNDFEGTDPLVINFNLTNSDTATSCDLYTNDTGSFIINETSTGLTNGVNTINYNPIENNEYTIQAYLTCNDTSGTDTTTTKTINIDLVNLLIDINFPTNNSNFNEDAVGINIDVDFINTNLEDIFIEFYDVDDTTLLQSNSSLGIGGGEFTFIDGFTFGSFGTYRLTAYGNDSAGNFNNKSHYFTFLNNVLSVDWDSSNPPNSSSFINQTNISFSYDLVVANLTSVNCDLLENNIIVNNNVHTVSGSYDIEQTYTTPLSETNNYLINCTSSTFDVQTSTKEITITNELLFIPNFGFLSILPLLFVVLVFIFLINKIKSVTK